MTNPTIEGKTVRVSGEPFTFTGEVAPYWGEDSKPLWICKAAAEHAHGGFRYRIVRCTREGSLRYRSHFHQFPNLTPPMWWAIAIRNGRKAPTTCLQSEL